MIVRLNGSTIRLRSGLSLVEGYNMYVSACDSIKKEAVKKNMMQNEIMLIVSN